MSVHINGKKLLIVVEIFKCLLQVFNLLSSKMMTYSLLFNTRNAHLTLRMHLKSLLNKKSMYQGSPVPGPNHTILNINI